MWTNGGTVGLDWTNIATNVGYAYSTESGTNPGVFDDSVAILTGSWGPNQVVEGVVKRTNPQADSVFEEVELWLHGTITAHSITGYEVDIRIAPSTFGGYLQIARWNGAFADYTPLTLTGPGINGAMDGDVVRAEITGSNFSVYLNNTLVGTASDSTYANGNPGMGAFLQGTISGGNTTDYGWKSYSASDGVTSVGNGRSWMRMHR